MTTVITVGVQGYKAAKLKLEDPKLIGDPALKLLRELGELGQKTAKNEAPYDLGIMRNSIMLDVHPSFAAVTSAYLIAPILESGRRRGQPMPPQLPLRAWAARHGWSGSVFPLARAIARRGIKGRFFFKKADAVVKAAAPGFVAEAEKSVKAKWDRA